jgi:structural maintenance of chromosome 3 (chondroitin sulfate proteoglycan 6)
LIKRLREKTLEVQDLSSKMDDLQNRNEQLELAMKKIETFDLVIYEEAKRGKTVQQLTKDIQEKVVSLDAFPRKNRHCVEWYDKYSAKYTELKKKFEEQIETEQGVLRLLKDLDEQKQQALEKNFVRLSANFCDIFQRIVPTGWAELRLVKKDKAEESQISHPSQF